MAKKRNNPGAALSEGGNYDLTSMIDVTFLLLIFFMLVTKLSDSAKSKLTLPDASKAVADDKPVPGRIVLNVMKDGSVEVMGKKLSQAEVNDLLRLQAAITTKKGEGDFANQAILIRADSKAEFAYVQNVMGLCMRNKIWRIAFGTNDPKFGR